MHIAVEATLTNHPTLMKKPMTTIHWDGLASQWNRLASPLRPCAEDVEIMRRALAPGDGLYLLLGVTPELASLPSNLVAIDNNAAMIGALWPRNQAAPRVIQGDWLSMPFASRTFDAIIGDGSLTLLSYPTQYERLFGQLKRVVKPGGKILIRLFVSPEQSETSEHVCHEALSGRIRSFHAFKWRLSMAIAAASPEHNVSVAETHATFDRLLPDRHRLAEVTGWNLEDIATIDLYRGSSARYSYPTLAQVRQILPQGIKEIGLAQGSYELAERCPTLILEASD
jgi:SAM-dependent methyltransferase